MKQSFAFDDRSMAAARACAGLVVLGDLVFRSVDLRAMYTNQGVLPGAALFSISPGFEFPSIYMWNDTVHFVVLLFLAHALSAVCLTLGYRTKLASFFCWWFTASLQYRNPLCLNGGDTLLRLLLFIGIFTNWSATWSVDARMRDSSPQSGFSWPKLAFGSQMVMIYLFAALNKWHPVWIDGTALYYSLTIDHMITEHAVHLYKNPELMKFLSFAVVGFEFFGALLLLVAWPRLRASLVVMFLLMHFGFGLFLTIGIFRYAPLIGLLAFVPGFVWDRFGSQVGGSKKEEASQEASSSDSSLADGIVIIFLIYGFLCCLEGLLDHRTVPAPVHAVGKRLGLNQDWPMFTFLDQVKDGWYVLDAVTEDGSRIDLLRDAPLSWDKPGVGERKFNARQRWRRYFSVVMLRPYQDQLPWMSQYFRRRWNIEHPGNQVVKLTITFLNDPQGADYRYDPPETWILHQWEEANQP